MLQSKRIPEKRGVKKVFSKREDVELKGNKEIR